MRDMLQKPWIVGLLSLVALFFVYTNVVSPLINDGRNSVPSSIVTSLSSNFPFTSNEQADIVTVKEIAMADWNALSQQKSARNPFAPAQKVVSKKKKSGPRWINWPTVTAIVIGSTEKFAILNGNTVQEGQKSGKFKVVKISVNSVRVRFGKREKTLTLNARGGR